MLVLKFLKKHLEKRKKQRLWFIQFTGRIAWFDPAVEAVLQLLSYIYQDVSGAELGTHLRRQKNQFSEPERSLFVCVRYNSVILLFPQGALKLL